MSSAAPSSPLRTKNFLKIHESNPPTSESKTEKLNPTRSLTSNDNDRDPADDNHQDLHGGVGLFTKESFHLFRKLFQLSKPQSLSDKGKPKTEHSCISGRYVPLGPGPLVAPKFGSSELRPLSMFEKRLLPEIDKRTRHLSTSGDMPVTSQLTIFYGGAVHVYNNVPIDKAQAIMLVAGESSVSETKTSDERREAQEMEKRSPKPKPESNNPFGFPESICKLQVEELPIARKNSISHFLKKRRERITNKSPYPASARASSSTSPRPKKQKENDASSSKDKEAMATEGLDVNKTVSLSPFPSRLGYFCPKPANMTK